MCKNDIIWMLGSTDGLKERIMLKDEVMCFVICIYILLSAEFG